MNWTTKDTLISIAIALLLTASVVAVWRDMPREEPDNTPTIYFRDCDSPIVAPPVFVLTNNEVIYGDENSHRDSTGTWHLKDRKLPDRVIKRIHF